MDRKRGRLSVGGIKDIAADCTITLNFKTEGNIEEESPPSSSSAYHPPEAKRIRVRSSDLGATPLQPSSSSSSLSSLKPSTSKEPLSSVNRKLPLPLTNKLLNNIHNVLGSIAGNRGPYVSSYRYRIEWILSGMCKDALVSKLNHAYAMLNHVGITFQTMAMLPVEYLRLNHFRNVIHDMDMEKFAKLDGDDLEDLFTKNLGQSLMEDVDRATNEITKLIRKWQIHAKVSYYKGLSDPKKIPCVIYLGWTTKAISAELNCNISDYDPICADYAEIITKLCMFALENLGYSTIFYMQSIADGPNSDDELIDEEEVEKEEEEKDTNEKEKKDEEKRT